MKKTFILERFCIYIHQKEVQAKELESITMSGIKMVQIKMNEEAKKKETEEFDEAKNNRARFHSMAQ